MRKSRNDVIEEEEHIGIVMEIVGVRCILRKGLISRQMSLVIEEEHISALEVYQPASAVAQHCSFLHFSF